MGRDRETLGGGGEPEGQPECRSATEVKVKKNMTQKIIKQIETQGAPNRNCVGN